MNIGDKVIVNKEVVEESLLIGIDNYNQVKTDWDQVFILKDIQDIEYGYIVELNGDLGFKKEELIKVVE